MLHSIMVRNSIMFVKKPTAGYGVDIGFRWFSIMLAQNLSTATQTLLIHNSERFDVQVSPGLSDLAKDNLPLSFGCTIAAAQVCGHITSKECQKHHRLLVGPNADCPHSPTSIEVVLLLVTLQFLWRHYSSAKVISTCSVFFEILPAFCCVRSSAGIPLLQGLAK
ncbi:hypothetical protein MUK42_01013 [Musa troglodytarum]|uniref:Uncharacterized protein n=1 Tax=Musa troglodytarum TaxID=320322 RepID=A0A9E7JV00_9LILI|nr:hypothetical protein MUK42_01013 [Musa troglodytarum]